MSLELERSSGVAAQVRAARTAQPGWAASPLARRAAVLEAAARGLAGEASVFAEALAGTSGRSTASGWSAEVDPDARCAPLARLDAALASWLRVRSDARACSGTSAPRATSSPGSLTGRRHRHAGQLPALPGPAAGRRGSARRQRGPVEARAGAAPRSRSARPRCFSEPACRRRCSRSCREAPRRPARWSRRESTSSSSPEARSPGSSSIVLQAGHGRPAVLELSGRHVAVVLADADLDLAARGLAWAKLANGGRNCVSVQLVLAARAVVPALLDAPAPGAGRGRGGSAAARPRASAPAGGPGR